MNKYLIPAFTLLFLISCNDGNNTTTEDENFCDCEMLALDNLYNHFYLKDRKEPYTGICKSFYSGGQIKQERQLVDGKNNGFFKNYSISGVLLEEGGFLNNRHHGVFKYYDDEGNLILEIEYDNGIPILQKENN